MKKLLFALLLLFSLASSAQVDSSLLRSGKLTLRVNDCEYISTFIAYNQTFENLYDSIKTKLRFGNYPAGATLVTVDSVSNEELVQLSLVMRVDYNNETAPAIERIKTAIRATNSNYVISRMDSYKAIEATAFTNRKNEGKRRLRKQ